MGYTTDFNGMLTLSKPLTDEQLEYLAKFKNTRRMKRDVSKLMESCGGKDGFPGTSKENNTPEEIYGKDGEYFVGGTGSFGQDRDASIIDYNTPPGQLGYNEKEIPWDERYEENNRRNEMGECQPSLWCQWEIGDFANEPVLQWDGGEKFYNYVEWLKYLINHFFSKWGVILNGEIDWYGEDREDIGKIVVKDNVVTVKTGTIVYDEKYE